MRFRSARPAKDYPLGELAENAVALSWPNAALLPPLHRLISMRIGRSVSVWASPRISDWHLPNAVLAMSLPGLSLTPPYDQARVPLPASSAAPSKTERSEDDPSSIPSASGNRLDLIRAAC